MFENAFGELHPRIQSKNPVACFYSHHNWRGVMFVHQQRPCMTITYQSGEVYPALSTAVDPYYWPAVLCRAVLLHVMSLMYRNRRQGASRWHVRSSENV